MSEKSKFIKGTIILICANAIAKILGAIFKIPLTYILKEEGMAVYTTAFSAYTLFLTLVTSGFPFAATKLLSEYAAKGKHDRIRPVVRSVGTILFLLGSLGTVIMYITAPKLALLMHEANATGAIKAISPSVALVAVGAIYKSSNEARSALLSTAFSQVTEAVLKLLCGLYLAYRLCRISLYKAAEGAILSVSIGEAFATSLLFIMWIVNVRKLPKSKGTKCELRSVLSVALPMLLTGGAMGLLSVAEVSTIRGSLSKIQFSPESANSFLLKYSAFTDAFDTLSQTLKLTSDGVRKLYGGFSGYAQTVFNLPIGIIATVSAAATPMFAKAINIGKPSDVVNAAEKVCSVILTLALPSAAVFLLFPEEVLFLLFGNRFSADMLASLSVSLIFLSIANMLIAILHLSGNILAPFLALSAGLILKIVLSAILIKIPEINILGAGLACLLSAIFIFLEIMFIFKSNFGAFPHLLKTAANPLSATFIMLGIMKPFLAYLNCRFDARVAFILSSIAGGLGYFLTLLLIKRRKK